MWFSMINRNVAFVLLFGVLAGNALAQTGFTETALARAVPFWWPTTVDLPPGAEPTRDQVLVLLKELFPDPYKGDGLPIQDVEAFRFVPLAPGKIHLVVVADFTGRAFFNVVEVIHCERQTCQTIGIQSDAPNDLDKQLVDIDGDGVYELITKQLVEFYRGGDTKPIYTYSIRKLMGRGLVDGSSKYAEYFTSHLLPKITETMRKWEQLPDPTLRAEGRASAQFAYDDYRRRVLGEKTAGFEHALAWLEADNDQIRFLALMTLEAMSSSAADAKLNELLQSPDKRIADGAEGALLRRFERRLRGEIE